MRIGAGAGAAVEGDDGVRCGYEVRWGKLSGEGGRRCHGGGWGAVVLQWYIEAMRRGVEKCMYFMEDGGS